jgi:hypothetical protein
MRQAPLFVARTLAPLVLLIIGSRLSAQPPAMSGVVHHALTGKPMECLHVALADSLDRTVAHAVTDASGTFVVVAPDTGTFRVRFIVRPYEPIQGPLLHLTSGMVTEQGYAVSFDHQVEEFDAGQRPAAPTVDLGEWSSVRVVVTRRRATDGEFAYAKTRAFEQTRAGAEFIVDANGRPRGSSWRMIAATDQDIALRARSMIQLLRFEPARIGQQPVCELQVMNVGSFRSMSPMRQ